MRNAYQALPLALIASVQAIQNIGGRGHHPRGRLRRLTAAGGVGKTAHRDLPLSE